VVDAVHAAGKTVIVITHDMDFCAENFNRVVAISDGNVLADGTTAEVMAQAELLATTGVEPAQLTRLGQALGLKDTVLTQEDLLRGVGAR
jgi:energy-coupling factor transport system ATP-binding protein